MSVAIVIRVNRVAFDSPRFEIDSCATRLCITVEPTLCTVCVAYVCRMDTIITVRQWVMNLLCDEVIRIRCCSCTNVIVHE